MSQIMSKLRRTIGCLIAPAPSIEVQSDCDRRTTDASLPGNVVDHFPVPAKGGEDMASGSEHCNTLPCDGWLRQRDRTRRACTVLPGVHLVGAGRRRGNAGVPGDRHGRVGVGGWGVGLDRAVWSCHGGGKVEVAFSCANEKSTRASKTRHPTHRDRGLFDAVSLVG